MRHSYALWTVLMGTGLAVLLGGQEARALDLPADPIRAGRLIVENQEERHKLTQEQTKVTMVLVNRRGKKKKRKVEQFLKRGAEDLDKFLIRFLSPQKVKGTYLLTWEQKDRDDDQWLYLPALRKIKRVPSNTKRDRFMGTDFSYEDLRSEDLDTHQYKLVGAETLDGHEHYVVEAYPATRKEKKESGYSKRKFWVRKGLLFTTKIEYYDRTGRLTKVQTNRDLVQVSEKAWRANKILMKDLEKNHSTENTVDSRDVTKAIPDKTFNPFIL